MRGKKSFKPFKAPAGGYKAPVKENSPAGTDESISDNESAKKKNEHIEAYEVMYTKHINQKIKSWEEGLFQYNLKNFKATLFNDMQKTDCIDTKYMRIKPDFYPDEEFRTNKFLV